MENIDVTTHPLDQEFLSTLNLEQLLNLAMEVTDKIDSLPETETAHSED